ncbi:hypothetical protein E2F47_01925 [Mycobacterium eburneum]|nr:hypothetical protein [Mycobacterium eburneum]TDH57550.1 hypothetical protein E2F47_01925 [Mycobacterium eburneum]
MAVETKTLEEARAQAAECLGFTVSECIRTADGTVFEIPNPSLLDDEQQTRYDQLLLESESWDRHPDVTDDDGNVIRRGALLEPNRKGGALVENFDIQQAKAILGDRYPAFRAAGGRAKDVTIIWWKMNRQLNERRAADSKSAGGDSAVAAVPDADRGGPEPVSPPADS